MPEGIPANIGNKITYKLIPPCQSAGVNDLSLPALCNEPAPALQANSSSILNEHHRQSKRITAEGPARKQQGL
jgi:hypothetical protein